MSKKLIVLIIISVLFCSNIFTEENPKEIERFFLGGGLTFLPENIGAGNLEFATLLFNKYIDIRSHILLRVGGFTRDGINYGLIRPSGKVSVGIITFNNIFRFYSFAEGGFGFFANNKESKDINDIPVTYNFGGGGGFDVFYVNDGSVFLEVGYIGHRLESEYRGGVMVQIGFRAYF
jgi:hypothetical protein